MSDYYDRIFTDDGKTPTYRRSEVNKDDLNHRNIQKSEQNNVEMEPPIYRRSEQNNVGMEPPIYRRSEVNMDDLNRRNVQKSEQNNIGMEPPIYRRSGDDASQVFQRNRQASVGQKPTVRMSDKKKAQSDTTDKSERKKLRAVAVMFAVGIAVGVFGHSLSNKLDNDANSKMYLRQYDYITWENKHFNVPGESGNYWYDTDQMGKEVAKSSDPQLALYAVYNRLNYKPVLNTSEVFTSAKAYATKNGIDNFDDTFNNSETFDDYVRSLGCVDKNGETDFKAYNDSMKQIALAKSMVADATKNATTISNEDRDSKGGK